MFTNGLNTGLTLRSRVKKTVHTDFPPKKKFWVQRLIKKVRLTFFWNLRRAMTIDFIEIFFKKTETENRASYGGLLYTNKKIITLRFMKIFISFLLPQKSRNGCRCVCVCVCVCVREREREREKGERRQIKTERQKDRQKTAIIGTVGNRLSESYFLLL